MKSARELFEELGYTKLEKHDDVGDYIEYISNDEDCRYVYDWQGFNYEEICPLIDKLIKENQKYKEVMDKLKEDLNLIIEYGNGEDASRYDKQYGEFAKNHLKYMDELLKEVE